MKKTLLTLSIALASLLAANAYAQKDVPGEGRAAPSAPATKEEKATAKAARREEGAKVSKQDTHSDKPTSTATKKVSKAEKDAAKSKRKTAGADATKATKVDKDPTAKQ